MLNTDSIVVYLIEDNQVDSLIEGSVIKKTLLEVRLYLFYRAQEALTTLGTHLKGNQQEQLPHLLFLDIAMPEMDGFAFLEEYVRLQFHNLPKSPLIYILTTSLSSTLLQKAKSHPYVEDVLFKPFSQKAFAAILDKHFPFLSYRPVPETGQRLGSTKELTIHNWVSEYKRLERSYQILADKQSLEARAILDQLEAVWQIIHEINSRNQP